MATEVPRIPSLSPSALAARMAAHEPVVLTDVVPRWPAGRGWSLAHLRERFGDRSLVVRGGDRRTWKQLCSARLDAYVDFIGGSDATPALAEHRERHPYAAFNVLEGAEEDTPFRPLVPDDFRVGPSVVWIGPERSMTPLHLDESGHTLLAQIVGRKRVLLFPYDQSRFLYPSDVFDYTSVFSEVNLDAPDPVRHPDYRHARPIEVILEPGELLLMPMRMWHEIHALDASVSVTVRTAPQAHQRSREMRRWRLKGLGHLMGLYKPDRCLCHIVDVKKLQLDRFTADRRTRALLAMDRVSAHGRDLSEMLGW